MIKFKILITIILLAYTHLANADTNIDSSDINLNASGSVCDILVSNLNDMKKEAKIILNAMAEQRIIDRQQTVLLNQHKFNPEKYDKLVARLNLVSEKLTKYSDGLFIINIANNDISNVVSTIELNGIIDNTINKLVTFKHCLYPDNGYSKNEACTSIFNSQCSDVGFDATGLYHESTSNMIDINKNYLDLKHADNTQDAFNRLLCYHKGKNSGSFKQDAISVDNFKLDSISIHDLSDDIKYSKMCINNAWITDHNNTVSKLKLTYPDMYDKPYIYNLERLHQNCNVAATSRCYNTYTIRKEIVLSYLTIGCEVRDVTKADVENDIKLLDSNVDRLKQSTLLDDIAYCQAAADKGYSWYYIKPIVQANCNQKNTKKKTAKRKKKLQ